MAKIIDTSAINPLDMSGNQGHWVYNGLDCCITHEIHTVLQEYQTPNSELIYSFERAMQAPALELMLTGIRIDLVERNRMVNVLQADAARLETYLNRMADAIWDKPLNPKSPKQLKEFLYGAMHLPEQHAIVAGKRKVSTNRESLEKLEVYIHARPIVRTILAIRDCYKQAGTLLSGVDPDQRMRCGYNVAGTITGRWSSNTNAFRTGTNLQNIQDRLRRIFVADPGMKLAYIDLEQAESRLVGFLAWLVTGRDGYLNACEGGDLHTTVCQMVWPNLGWTGELSHDKNVIAGQLFYRDWTYRDMSKRGGHGTNYYGQPQTMAKHLKVETKVMETFQRLYFQAFPEIPEWHQWVAEQIQTTSQLTTPLGRTRTFFGRTSDDATLREAIAYSPQSTIGDILNLALYKVWQFFQTLPYPAKLLAQVHDAIMFQFPEEYEDEIIPQVMQIMQIPIPGPGRNLIIPCDAQTGWNWQHYVTQEDVDKALAKGKRPPLLNLDGLKKWKGNDKRTRQVDPATSLLDRRLS